MPASTDAAGVSEALRAIEALLAVHARGGDPRGAGLDLVCGALLAHLRGGADLVEALGLRGAGRGSRRAVVLHKIARRDHHLRRAFEAAGSDLDRFWRRMQEFDRITWPKWEGREHPPAYSDPTRTELFHAARAWPLPQKARLRQIL